MPRSTGEGPGQRGCPALRPSGGKDLGLSGALRGIVPGVGSGDQIPKGLQLSSLCSGRGFLFHCFKKIVLKCT